MENFRASPNIRTEADIRNAIEAELLSTFDFRFPDVEIAWNLTHGRVNLADGDLVTDAGLQTAIAISLFTDARAGADDRLPDGESDPRGWWADELASIQEHILGSKLWLLCREKQEQRVVNKAEHYARESLRWLTEDRVASKVTVAGGILRPGWLYLEPTIYRPDNRVATYRYDYNWRAQEFRLTA